LQDDINSAKLSMAAGAKGVVSKEVAYADLAKAMEFVSSGRIFTGMAQPAGHPCSSAGIELLSKREIDILQLVGKGLTSKQIGEKLFISHRTVDTHRMRIMQKLDIHNGPGLTKFAMENGLV